MAQSNLGAEHDPFEDYKEAVFESLMADVETCESDAEKHMEMGKDIIRDFYSAGKDADACVYTICTTFGIC